MGNVLLIRQGDYGDERKIFSIIEGCFEYASQERDPRCRMHILIKNEYVMCMPYVRKSHAREYIWKNPCGMNKLLKYIH